MRCQEVVVRGRGVGGRVMRGRGSRVGGCTVVPERTSCGPARGEDARLGRGDIRGDGDFAVHRADAHVSHVRRGSVLGGNGPGAASRASGTPPGATRGRRGSGARPRRGSRGPRQARCLGQSLGRRRRGAPARGQVRFHLGLDRGALFLGGIPLTEKSIELLLLGFRLETRHSAIAICT